MKKKFLCALSILSLFCPLTFFAQASACPSVNAGPDVSICSGNCTTLTATVQGSVATSSYAVQSIPYNPYPFVGSNQVLVNIDDIWSNTIPLPFCFNFFGQTYNSFLIGSNSIVTFDVTQANGYCQWPINNAIPSNQDPMNSVMAPWEDIDPSQGSSAADISWQVYGSSPCREMVISWDSISLFDCWSTNFCTTQMVLHETTNIIDVYCERKELCTSWNGGAAIEGIQNATGTVAYVVPGRNFPTQWTANNDGYRFMPNGAPNYTIQWTDQNNNVVGNTNSITVCPTQTTTYTATVTNTSCAGNIVVSDQVVVTVSNSLSATVASTPSLCTSSSGTATATPVGGTGPYTYSWNPTGQTTQTANGLGSGTYTVTVTDALGCSTQQTVTITNSGNMSASVTSQANVTCNNGNNGSATVTPSGGTAPYTYSWSPTGGNNATANNLPAGSYTCTITDNSGCTFTQQVTITQPTALAVTSTSTNATCNGNCDGSATANPTGGTPGYTYSWSTVPSQTTATATGLCAASYTCLVTDANGCTTSQQVVITQPTLLTVSVSVTPPSCFGTGSATATSSGGTGSYTYSWSPTGETTATINQGPGTYTVNVTDANGCTTTQTAVIPQGSLLSTTSTFTNANCFGSNDGTATVNPSGGNPPLTYSWSPTGGNNATATGLSPGTYTCTVTDSTGCTSQQTVTITQPTQITASNVHTNVSCNGGNNGTASVNASGGTGTLSYSWSPAGGTGSSASGLNAGTYTCTITDANGCTSTQQVTITQPAALLVTTTGDSVCTGMNAVISANASGGTPAYTYSWSNNVTSASQTVTVNATSNYTVNITDANGCPVSGTVTVTANPLPNAAFTTNASNGVFTLTGVTGDLCFTDASTGAAAWGWTFTNSPPSFQQSPCVTVTAADTGSYCATLVVVTDHGCLDTATECVDILNQYYFIPNVFTPNGDGNNDVFMITNVGFEMVSCTIYNRWGNLIYQWDSPTDYWDGKNKNGNMASDGVYYYTATLTDFSGKTITEKGFVHLLKGK